MKQYIAITALLVAGIANADVLLLSSPTINHSDDGGSAGVDQTITRTRTLSNDSGGDLVWDVGETFSMQFDITVTNPDYISNSGGLQIALGDNSEALGFGIRFSSGGTKYWNTAVDSSAGGGGGFSVPLGSSSDRTAVSNSVIGSSFDLQDDGESARFLFVATRTATDVYDLSVTWSDLAGTASDTLSITRTAVSAGAGDTVDSFTEIITRITDTGDIAGSAYNMSNFSVSVIPEPATLGLVAMVGAGLLGVRRLFS